MFDAWMASPLRDSEGREKLWLSTTLLTRVEDVLRKRVMNGKVAEKNSRRFATRPSARSSSFFNFA
jgi:hypothetical protein